MIIGLIEVMGEAMSRTQKHEQLSRRITVGIMKGKFHGSNGALEAEQERLALTKSFPNKFGLAKAYDLASTTYGAASENARRRVTGADHLGSKLSWRWRAFWYYRRSRRLSAKAKSATQ